MTLLESRRLSDADLAEIGRRMVSPITDEGLRAWYRHDVEALVAEVLALRRERAAALLILKAGTDDAATSLVELVQRFAEPRTVRKRTRRT